nr:hypothetical protein [Tanacetum cinerariifolium]
MVPGFLWGRWMEVVGSMWSDGERQESGGDGIVGSGRKSWCEQWLFKRGGRRQEDEGDDDEEGNGDDDDEDNNGEEGNDDDVEQEVDRDDDKDDDEEEGRDANQEYDDEYAKETRDEKSFDPIPQTSNDIEDEGDGEEDQGLNIGEEGRHVEEEEEDELYRDININQGRGLQASLEVEDSHVTLTPINLDGEQQSLPVSSQFVTSLLNPILDVGMESIFETTSQLDIPTPTYVAPLPITAPTMTPSTIATITTTSQAPILPTTAQVSKILPKIEQAVNEQLKAKVLTRSSHSSRTSYAVVVDLSEMELKKILIEKIEGNKSIQRSDEQRNLYKALVEAYESDKIILDTYGETVTLKRRRDDDADKDEEPSAGPDQGSKRRREGKEPESASAPIETATRSTGRSSQGSRSRQASASESALVEEPMQTTSQMEEPSHPEFDAAVYGSIQPWISELAKQADSRSSFNELMDTPLDNSNFLIKWLRVDTLTPELLAGPTYELMKGSCKSLIELEYYLEEVYKATTDQLDWVNPEGQQYPHNLLQPLPLIPDNRGRRVIPFEHFINNDLEYLHGGASSRKYTTSIMKTKAADYGHIKWIEDLVPRTMWINEPIGYDKHALWGVSHWRCKRQQFYGFAVNRESNRDVYSKRRIIAVTELKIIEWHSYKHLDRITVRRDDDKRYKFKEGDFKRLRIQDIKDMLLLLVQGKLTNLTVKERFSFNVSLRMFTRSIRKEAYTAYSNLQGFVYQNKDKKNMLMRIDELLKFSDGMLTEVRTALDDRLKGIRMRYLPQTIWRKSVKDRAAAMIQAIDKRLKTRRIMRSLERFIGGRLYEEDFRMLQRTI